MRFDSEFETLIGWIEGHMTLFWRILENKTSRTMMNHDETMTVKHHEPWRTMTKPWQRNITNHHVNHDEPWRTMTNHDEPPRNIMNHHEPPWNITNHHKSSPIIMKHCKLSWNIMNHYELPQNIMNHHEPPHVLTKTACFGQCLSEFSMDLHETFTK